VLQGQLDDAMRPLDPTMRAALGSLLELSPSRRKDASSVLHSSLLSGQVTTTVRRAANREVLDTMATMKEEMIVEINASHARLEEAIEAGNQRVLKQVKVLEGIAAPASSAVAQALVELQVAIEEAGEGSSEAVAALEGVHETLRQLQTKVETVADQGGDGDKAIKEMLSELLAQAPGNSMRGDAALAQVGELSRCMQQMSFQMADLAHRQDAAVSVHSQQMAYLGGKLDQLLTGEHEQIFHYFMLTPKPSKGYMGRALSSMKPKHWLAKPMLLVPLYMDGYGQLRAAPVQNKYSGFKVSQPKEFVRKHPRMVQLGMLAIKVGIKAGLAVAGANLPAASLDAIVPNLDSLTDSVLAMGMEAVANGLVDDDGELREGVETMVDGLGDPQAQLDVCLENETFKELSKLEYNNFKAWMDKEHPGWPAQCGLQSAVNPVTGKLQWLPVGADGNALPVATPI